MPGSPVAIVNVVRLENQAFCALAQRPSLAEHRPLPSVLAWVVSSVVPLVVAVAVPVTVTTTVPRTGHFTSNLANDPPDSVNLTSIASVGVEVVALATTFPPTTSHFSAAPTSAEHSENVMTAVPVTFIGGPTLLV